MIPSSTRQLLSRSLQNGRPGNIIQPSLHQMRSIRPSPTLPRRFIRRRSHPISSSSSSSPYSLFQSSSRSFHSTRSPNDAPRSPFAVFVETLRSELKKSQEIQENVKTLQGEAGKLQDSETMRRMKEAYERARITTSIKENPRLMKAAQQLKEGGGKVSDAVNHTLKSMEESEIGRALGAMTSRLARDISSATAPVRNTEAYKAFTQTLTDAFDDGGSSLRIFTDADLDAAEARKIKRNLRLKKIGRLPPSEDAETAGIVMTKAEEDLATAAENVDLSDMDIEAIKRAAEAGARKGREDAERSRKEMQEEMGEDQAQETETETETGASVSGSGDGSTSKQPSSNRPSNKPLGFAARTRSIANDQAGSALVFRPEPAYKQAWSNFTENSTFFRKLGSLREAYDESENPFIERVRGITETIGGWFEQNETSKVIQSLKILEPSFSLESFQKELREYIIPELIDSYHSAVRPLLRQWCGEATFNVLMATLDPYLQRGYTINGRLLDVRNIDIVQGRMLENDVPVLVVSFSSQELLYFKDPKTGQTVAGKESQAELCRYALVITRVENEMGNEITGGWKILELARRGQTAFL